MGELDTCTEVVVYAKLPRGFLIPTPVGDYNPDWAISFKEGMVKHVHFVAETTGLMSSMVLNEIEQTKIKCARKFLKEINKKFALENVKYDVVDSSVKLMDREVMADENAPVGANAEPTKRARLSFSNVLKPRQSRSSRHF